MLLHMRLVESGFMRNKSCSLVGSWNPKIWGPYDMLFMVYLVSRMSPSYHSPILELFLLSVQFNSSNFPVALGVFVILNQKPRWAKYTL